MVWGLFGVRPLAPGWSRIEVRPQDPANHKINFVYTLGEKPQMVEEDDASSQA